MRGGSIASSLVCLLGDERHGRVPTVTGEDRTLRMPSGAAIHARFWGIPSLPDGSAPRALVLLVHGYGHYMDGFFDRLASELCALGLACAGVDLPGHGLSDGDRGLVVPIVECAEAALRVRQEAYLDLPSGLPCIFYGESLGGAVATMAATLAPADCQALCLMWPLMGVPAPPNTVTHVFLSVLAALCPGLVVRAAVEAGDYSFADPKKREDVSPRPTPAAPPAMIARRCWGPAACPRPCVSVAPAFVWRGGGRRLLGVKALVSRLDCSMLLSTDQDGPAQIRWRHAGGVRGAHARGRGADAGRRQVHSLPRVCGALSH